MNRIDRLICRAREARPVPELAVAIIQRDGASWTAEAQLWDGIQGHAPTVRRVSCAALEAAVAHVRATGRDVPVIIDDIGG